MSAELARRLVAHLDLTDLRPGLDDAAIERLVERGASPYGPVAGLCVHPSNVASLRAAIDRAALPSRLVAIAGFPDGSGDPDATLDELRQAGDAGADEIDLLYPSAAAMRGDQTGLELVARAAAATGFLKVILESSAWSDPGRLVATARDVLTAGASMLKTGSGAAHIAPVRRDDIELLAEVAAETATGGLKVSGGVDCAIATYALAAAQRRFGAGVTAARFRIGASRLLDELEGQATDGEGY